ncbi:MAG: hypothetical protein GY751_04675 [Bacteroidetes bacterium]|nr:hypothetical protein [Bacteroidota bacterium]
MAFNGCVLMLTYFKNKNDWRNWDRITREERVFCFELFNEIRKGDLEKNTALFNLLKKKYNVSKFQKENSQNILPKEKLDLWSKLKPGDFQVGVEVCFFRDLLKWNDGHVKDSEYSQKRTFDLALFSEKAIIIIEAKANQGFEKTQLDDIENDEKKISNLFKELEFSIPSVFSIALYSSKYKPIPKTKAYFHSCITWEEISGIYKSSKPIFDRANEIYGDYIPPLNTI